MCCVWISMSSASDRHAENLCTRKLRVFRDAYFSVTFDLCSFREKLWLNDMKMVLAVSGTRSFLA